MDDPGHLGALPRPRRPRGRACAVVAVALAVLAAALAALPVASFFAGPPALAALVLALVAAVLGARRALPVIAVVVAVLALAVAVPVSLHRIGAQLEQAQPQAGFDERGGTLDDGDEAPGGSGRGETGALAAGSHRVVYEVLGTGTASITYTVFAGGTAGGSAEDAVAVPHERVQRLTVPAGEEGPARFSMVALAGNADDEVGCRITVDGDVVAERAASAGRSAACIAVAG